LRSAEGDTAESSLNCLVNMGILAKRAGHRGEAKDLLETAANKIKEKHGDQYPLLEKIRLEIEML